MDARKSKRPKRLNLSRYKGVTWKTLKIVKPVSLDFNSMHGPEAIKALSFYLTLTAKPVTILVVSPHSTTNIHCCSSKGTSVRKFNLWSKVDIFQKANNPQGAA